MSICLNLLSGGRKSIGWHEESQVREDYACYLRLQPWVQYGASATRVRHTAPRLPLEAVGEMAGNLFCSTTLSSCQVFALSPYLHETCLPLLFCLRQFMIRIEITRRLLPRSRFTRSCQGQGQGSYVPASSMQRRCPSSACPWTGECDRGCPSAARWGSRAR